MALHTWTHIRILNCSFLHCYHQNLRYIVLKPTSIQHRELHPIRHNTPDVVIWILQIQKHIHHPSNTLHIHIPIWLCSEKEASILHLNLHYCGCYHRALFTLPADVLWKCVGSWCNQNHISLVFFTSKCFLITS